MTEHPQFRISARIMERLWNDIEAQQIRPAVLVSRALDLELDETGGLSTELRKAEDAENYPKVAELMRVIQTATQTVVVDKVVVERLSNRELVTPGELQMGSVQLWSDKIRELGLVPIHENSTLYVWNAPYDTQFLGIMQNILPIIKAQKGMAPLILDNRE